MRRLGELQVQRRMTDQLIASEPVSIALSRPPAKVDDGAGGRVSTGVPTLQPVTDRFFADVTEDERFYSRNTIGQAVVTEHVLIGRYNDDIREGDYWDQGGRRFVVEYVHPERDYQTKARVVSYASP